MTDNWARSKIVSHSGKKCVCGGSYDLKHEVFELNPKSFAQGYLGLGKNYICYINKLKYGPNFKYCIKVLHRLEKPILKSIRNHSGLKMIVFCYYNPTYVFNTKLVFIICPKCDRKILLQYKLSPILGK